MLENILRIAARNNEHKNYYFERYFAACCDVVRCMKKIFIPFVIFVLFFFSDKNIYASILKVERDGNIVWKVLSDEDSTALEVPKRSSLEVKEVVKETPTSDTQILLKKSDQKISLVVTSNGSTKDLDVTNWKDDLVEIEERPGIQRVTIGLTDGKFSLGQNGITALTDYPINIDPKTSELSLTTSSGNRFISILPYQAVESVLRSRIVNKVESDRLEISEEAQELQYKIFGEKVLNFFDIYKYSIPIKTSVSATTGEILFVEAPSWYKIFGSLFSYMPVK